VASDSDPVAALYRVRPEDFVAARNRLVRELRGRGEAQAAAEVASLRRPTLSVWAANRLHEVAAGQLAELLTAGSEVEAAQARAAAGDAAARSEFRRLLGRNSALIDELVRAGRGFLEGEGYGASEEVVRRLTGTLRTAAADPGGLGRQLAEGRLRADLEPTGFEQLAAVPAAAPAVARRDAAREAAARATEARREAEEQERAAVAARTRADELERRARRLAAEARQAAEEASAAEEEARVAEELATEARRRAAEAGREAGR
jgi:hypothetical protein